MILSLPPSGEHTLAGAGLPPIRPCSEQIRANLTKSDQIRVMGKSFCEKRKPMQDRSSELLAPICVHAAGAQISFWRGLFWNEGIGCASVCCGGMFPGTSALRLRFNSRTV